MGAEVLSTDEVVEVLIQSITSITNPASIFPTTTEDVLWVRIEKVINFGGEKYDVMRLTSTPKTVDSRLRQLDYAVYSNFSIDDIISDLAFTAAGVAVDLAGDDYQNLATCLTIGEFIMGIGESVSVVEKLDVDNFTVACAYDQICDYFYVKEYGEREEKYVLSYSENSLDVEYSYLFVGVVYYDDGTSKYVPESPVGGAISESYYPEYRGTYYDACYGYSISRFEQNILESIVIVVDETRKVTIGVNFPDTPHQIW